MLTSLAARYRSQALYTSANWPIFWRARPEIPLALGLLLALLNCGVFWLPDVLEFAGLPLSVLTLLGVALFVDILLCTAAAGFWLFAIFRRLNIWGMPELENRPRYTTIVLGCFFVFGALLVPDLIPRIIHHDADYTWWWSVSDGTLAVVTALPIMVATLIFKIANVFSARVIFRGLMWFIASITIAIIAWVTVAKLSMPEPQLDISFIVIALLGLSLMHWPFLASLAHGCKRRYAEFAVASLIFWIPVAVSVVFGSCYDLFGVRGDPIPIFLIMAVSALGIDLGFLLATRLKTYPEL